MDYNLGSRFCGDCGKKWEDGCGHMGIVTPPKFSVGDPVYRDNGDEPPAPILDRALCRDHNPECGDGYDGHSASCIEKLTWYYEVKWWGSSSRRSGSSLHDRIQALNYRTWYWWWGGCGKPVFEEVKRSILDATREEVAAIIAKLEAAKAAKILALTTERDLGISIDLRKEGFP